MEAGPPLCICKIFVKASSFFTRTVTICQPKSPAVWSLFRFQPADALLQAPQKAAGVGTVHLGVMELERQLQRRFENAPVVPALDEEGGVENAAVHADGTVKLGIHDGGGTDDHTVGEIMVLAALRRLTRQAQIWRGASCHMRDKLAGPSQKVT